MHFYPHHIGDYRAATAHLSNEEDLAYRRLLDMYYDTENPIPLDVQWVSRRIRLDAGVVQAVLDDFFTATGDGYTHKRVEEELESFRKRSEKARQSANARWGAKTPAMRSHNASIADDMRGDATQEPLPINPITPLPPTVPVEGDVEVVPKRLKPEPGSAGQRFDEFWAAWPKGERKQDKAKCFAKWRRDKLDLLADLILADIATKRKTQKWQGGFVEAPLVYLNGSRWNDGVQPAEPGQEALSVGHWWDTKGGTEKRAQELGAGPWEPVGPGGVSIPWAVYVNKVKALARKAGELIE